MQSKGNSFINSAISGYTVECFRASSIHLD